MVTGGTRPNVIPDHARAVLDLRALRIADMRKIEKQLRGLRPILPGARLAVRGGLVALPWSTKSAPHFFNAQHYWQSAWD